MRYLLGVRPLVPGFVHVVVQPQLGPLAFARGTLPSIRGPISVAVNQTAGGSAGLGPMDISMSVSIPGSTTARLCLPLSACGAKGLLVIDGVPVQGSFDGAYACVDPVDSGTHVASCTSN